MADRRLQIADWGLIVALAIGASPPAVARAQEAHITIEVKDYASMPITGSPDGTGQTDGMLSRVNTLREEPGGARRLFVSDLNGPLYILDKETKKLTPYLDFNGRDGRPGVFHKLVYRRRLRQRPERILFRSGLRAQREVLHGPHGGSGGCPARTFPTTRTFRVERHRLRDHAGDRRRRARC